MVAYTARLSGHSLPRPTMGGGVFQEGQQVQQQKTPTANYFVPICINAQGESRQHLLGAFTRTDTK